MFIRLFIKARFWENSNDTIQGNLLVCKWTVDKSLKYLHTGLLCWCCVFLSFGAGVIVGLGLWISNENIDIYLAKKTMISASKWAANYSDSLKTIWVWQKGPALVRSSSNMHLAVYCRQMPKQKDGRLTRRDETRLTRRAVVRLPAVCSIL